MSVCLENQHRTEAYHAQPPIRAFVRSKCALNTLDVQRDFHKLTMCEVFWKLLVQS